MPALPVLIGREVHKQESPDRWGARRATETVTLKSSSQKPGGRISRIADAQGQEGDGDD